MRVYFSSSNRIKPMEKANPYICMSLVSVVVNGE